MGISSSGIVEQMRRAFRRVTNPYQIRHGLVEADFVDLHDVLVIDAADRERLLAEARNAARSAASST